MTKKSVKNKDTRDTPSRALVPAPTSAAPSDSGGDYRLLIRGISELMDQARRSSARAINVIMTATYWEIGRRIVEFEQGGAKRAEYGQALLSKMSLDLTQRLGRGFSVDNLERFRLLYNHFPPSKISATALRKSSSQTPSLAAAPISATALRKLGQSASVPFLQTLAERFPLSWSHYTRLLRLKSPDAFHFYHEEALRGGWTIKQLERQISSQFYERVALSRNKAAMLKKAGTPQPGDALTPEEEIKDPAALEFLNLKDEYSESDLEEALIQHLETFLLELGGDFCFVGRQRRLRVGNAWYRMDLLFFHRRLRCLVVVDLKVGEFTHADAGQMHLYLNYAREHWMREGENPPVGLILCAEKDEAVARYALEGLPNKVIAAEYRTALPDGKLLACEIGKTRKMLETRKKTSTKSPSAKWAASARSGRSSGRN